jgi:PAS domain S-box-containing protein
VDLAYSDLARLAAGVCQAPFASIALAGGPTIWCSPREALATAAVPQNDPIVELASIALRTEDGDAIGTLGVYGTAARQLTLEQRDLLMLVARQAVAQSELRARTIELALISAATPPHAHATPPHADATLAHALLDSAPVAIYHSDLTGTLTYANPEYRRIFGLSADQSTNDWAQGVHLADRARIEETWNDFCRQPRPVKFEYRTKPTAGTVRYICEQLVPAAGVSGFVGTISDFTDLVAARGDLRKAETLFRNTFDQAPIGIAYADRDGRFQRCNPAFCALLGFGTDELANRSGGDLTHSDDVAGSAAALDSLWKGDIDFVDLEKRCTRKDGSIMWVRTTIALVRDENGTPECSVEFLRDITSRKDADLELERVHKELMAASRQAGMAEVATNVLHNVGNILNSVNISASLVAERVKQSKATGVTRLAALLQDQGPRLGEFITGDVRGKRIPHYLATLGEQLTTDQEMTLKELASLRDNLEHIKDTVTMQQSYAKLCGVTETVEVADLVEDSLRLNAGAFVRHGVTLRREFSDVPAITVDKHKVLQILVNLVRNAKYACDESGRTDKLLILRIEPAVNAVRISVIDNGVGIPPENMGRLFSHGFTTRKSGHGFGLHSGALAAQDLGGTLRAESDGPGRGAAFILELPCVP